MRTLRLATRAGKLALVQANHVKELLAEQGVEAEIIKVSTKGDQDRKSSLRAIGGEDFAGVKPKFREQVYALLEKGEGAKPLAEQLEELRGKFEEYFISGQRVQRLPRFGGPTRGSMPRGDMGAAEQFSQAWGFGPRRNA